MRTVTANIQSAIRDVPDFPKPGIIFKDITPILKDPVLFQQVIDHFADLLKGQQIDYIAGIESRGFILAAPLALRLNAGFIPVRKRGKLPYAVERHEYDLEYGTDCIEIHVDAVEPGSRVVLIDDLLATGGTAAAATTLLGKLGANLVAVLFMVELSFLEGRAKLPDGPLTQALITY
jgi:adenine phosphoribosyltransferase